jgi:hypothetical protein
MVPKLVANEASRGRVVAGLVESTHFDEGDALLVVHHVQRFAL